ncbi:MAG: Uma2 family endonuclease [Chloroflexota bacterium]|nr:Uma2 family endonuclease [Chloroflexota bacterium]
MVVQERLFDVDDVWRLAHNPDNENVHFELIDGELFTIVPPGRRHGLLATEIAFYLRLFLGTHDIGEVTTDSGYYSEHDRHTLLGPDVAFLRYDRLPQPPTDNYVSVMPDLVVEIRSPFDTLAKIRRKAEVYLRRGTTIVWIVLPKQEGVEVWRLDESGQLSSEFLGVGDKLSGEETLPGFELEISLLFPKKQD